MNKKFGALIALAAMTAKIGLPDAALAQETENFLQQCEYISEIQTDRTALQRELELLLDNSPEALTCRFDTPDELREECANQCVSLIVSLLGGTPVAELPEDPY